MIVGVVIIKSGSADQVMTADDNDEIIILDMDVLENGECPYCGDELKGNSLCDQCQTVWNNTDPEEFAIELLKQEG